MLNLNPEHVAHGRVGTVGSHKQRTGQCCPLAGPGLDTGLRRIGCQLDVDDALSRASKRIGAEVRKVAIPIAEAAIDVDRESDLALASRILEEREAAAG